MADFIYEKPFQIEKDSTTYRLLTKDYVKVVEEGGRKILKVDPKGLETSCKRGCIRSLILSSEHLILKSLQQYLTILKQQIMTVLWHI